MKRILWITLSLVLLSGMGYSVAQTLTRPASTIPRPLDVAKAGRELAQAPGAPADFRQPPPPTAVGTGQSAQAPGAAPLVGGNGVVEPDGRAVDVSPSVPGRITAVLVTEGAHVAAGDILVTLTSETERAAVAVAEAEIAAAEARLAKVKSGSRVEDIRAAGADAKQARARAALSKGIAQRTEKLFKGGGATADELDRAKHQAEADAAAVGAAGARQSALANGSRTEDVVVAEADVTIAQSRLAEAQVRLAERDVRAPSAGEVLQVKVRAGEYAQPGGAVPLVVLGDTRMLTARLDIDERDVGAVAVGDSVVVRAKAYPGRDYPATVRALGRRMGRKNVRTDDPTERNDTKILEVVVTLGQSDGLFVGQRVVGYVLPK